jgi:mannose-1-phosphate guanylyltransferase / phosphomannomutase
VHEGVAIGDQVTLGDQSVIYPGVRIYPYKEVESGAQIHESVIWESRGSTKAFGKDGVVGLVNVDLTPDIAVRLGAAFGTALERGARVVASRESAPGYRMIKRALISGLNSTGISVADLRTLPAPVGKHLLKTEAYDAAFHVGAHAVDPEMVQIRLFEKSGVALSESLQKEIDKHFTRQELRRVPFGNVGSISYPPRGRESYAEDLLGHLDAEKIRGRGYRIVVDYGYSAGSFVLPLVLGPLGVESITAHGFESDSAGNPAVMRETIAQARRLVVAVDADFGAVFDRSAERLYLIDERGHEISTDIALLLYLQLLVWNGHGGTIVVPVTATSQVERLAGEQFHITRTAASLAALTAAAAQDGVAFAGATSGGYIFPHFLPAYDAIASLCRLLELFAAVERPLSELVDELPRPTLVHRQVPCPWAFKGTVMRVLNERFSDRDVDLSDGIKIFDERGWVQILPDADEPLIHIYAEGETGEASRQMEEEFRQMIIAVIGGEEIGLAS